ncbi:MAG TPA: hypothetical protein GXX18_18855 [Bacillales bacterium]|nr:hypothetical protein [Bacillales bacterium]
MKSLIVYGVNIASHHTLINKIKSSFEAIRADLAWELFLDEKGKNAEGWLTLPEGNPRLQWFDINKWLHQAFSSHVDMISDNTKKTLVIIISNCTPDVLEFIQRTSSIYCDKVGILSLNKHQIEDYKIIEDLKHFTEERITDFIKDGWLPPAMNYKDTKTALFEKCSKQKGDGEFTWLSGFLGSDRLYTQLYHLPPLSRGNRLHSHSDVDEMYLVLEGDGIVKTNRRDFRIKQGDIITKPRGSGLQTEIIAGERGLLIFDIEVWSRADQTDVVHYSEYSEILLRGKGLNHAFSTESSMPGNDIMEHYNQAYKRAQDGSKIF